MRGQKILLNVVHRMLSFGDPAAATAENADKQYDVFSDYVVDEVRALLG